MSALSMPVLTMSNLAVITISYMHARYYTVSYKKEAPSLFFHGQCLNPPIYSSVCFLDKYPVSSINVGSMAWTQHGHHLILASWFVTGSILSKRSPRFSRSFKTNELLETRMVCSTTLICINLLFDNTRNTAIKENCI